MSRSKLLSRLMFAGLVASAACSESGSDGGLLPSDPTGANGIVASINVLLPSSSLAAGATMQAHAELVDRNDQVISGGTFSWSTDNPAVATVSSAGIVTGVASGTVRVLATARGKTGTSAALQVSGTGTPTPTTASIASITVSLNASSLAMGQTTQASATAYDSAGKVLTGKTMAWSSSDTTIATVSSSGFVTARKAGSARIIAASGGKSGSATETVTTATLAPVATVAVTLNSSALTVGQTTQGSAVLRDASGNILSGRTITWSSSNTSVATVNGSGYITSVGAGSAVITATSETKSGSASLSVKAATVAPVASVSVSLASGSIATGGTSQASAVTKDASGNVLTGRSIAWSSSNSAVATVSTSGMVTGVAAGTAQITATSEGKTGSASVSVTAPPPPPAPSTGSAEPAGMSLIAQRPFSALQEDNWLLPSWSAPYFTIVTDAAAPMSPSNVARIRYPAGFAGGDSPALVERDLGGTATTLYTSLWVKLSSNWVGHQTGTNKVMHFWINGINRVFAYADGAGSDHLRPYMGLQQIAAPYYDGVGQTATGVNLRPNLVPTSELVRGQWYKWEIVMTSNTNGGANGTLDWYINGQHVGSYTGITYVGSGASRTWDFTKIDPTWGGLGGTIPADQYMYFDHVYISGK